MTAVSSRLLRAVAAFSALAGLSVGLGIGLTATALPASAAPSGTCAAPGLRSAAQQADAVFVGDISDSQAVPSADGGRSTRITHQVKVTSIYSGEVDSDQVEVTTQRRTRGNCGLGRLEIGTTYVFFATQYGDGWRVAADDGTTPVTSRLLQQLARILGSAHSPESPERPDPTFTSLEQPTTIDLGRSAAPGVAMVLLGLLGLIVVRRVSRR